MTKETALLEALRNEQARMETMRIINEIREMGGTQTILTLAGYMLTATPSATGGNTPAA